jgi:carboxypeptidase Taq
MDDCDRFFSSLKERIVPLIARITSATPISDACLKGNFPVASQEKFSRYLMEKMGIDLSRCGLGVTEHPFTTSIGSHRDVRITTNYDESNIASSMYSVIHEGGHALYDMHSDDSLAYTYLDGGVSMGIHESQSRFYENILGRSEAFINAIFPSICEFFPEQMEGVSATDFYRAVNLVTPSLIRTEADEVTYCLHVMVRYELERRIMSDELEVKDLPQEWNRLYREYLGVSVPCDREGVLQDSHWSGGGIGYFPSYALGSAYGAQLLSRMREDVDVDACLAIGDLSPINEWNCEHIWKYGCLKRSSDLLREAVGGEFDPSYYITYLEEKYSSLYSL